MGQSISKLFDKIFGKKNARILMIGLDAAGKTTILYRLQLGKVVETIPSIGFNVETVEYKNIKFTVWDVSGRTNLRTTLFRCYLENTQGVIFVVDSTDKERIEFAKEELHKVLDTEELQGVPLLVFANKEDLGDSMSAAGVAEKLELSKLRGRYWFSQGTCALKGSGLFEGLDWLGQNLNKKYPL